MLKDAKTKLLEALLSVIPIAIIVCVIYGLQYSSIFPSEMIAQSELTTFLISLIALILGMALFSLGSDVSMSKVGTYIGSSLSKKKSIVFMIVVTFFLGVMITIAEPDLTVLGDLLGASINSWVLKICIGIGVGIFLVVGILRIMFQKNLKAWIIFFYLIVFILACILDDVNGNVILSISFDSGGVTTGPITVPFLLTFGAGIAASRGGKDSSSDSFGVTGLCSIGPLISTMILLIITSKYVDLSQLKNSIAIDDPILHVLGQTALEIIIAILPITVFFFIYQFIFIKLPKKELIKILLGFAYTFFGLTLFLVAAKIGLIPIGYKLGLSLADPSFNGQYYYLLIIIAIVIGFAVVLVEPGVHVLNAQVEEISNGAIRKRTMLIALCIGVAIAIVLEVIRELCGSFPIIYYLAPIYLVSLGLTFFVPDIYTAVGFDSGGVASGTMSSCFVLPYIIGIATSLKTGTGFGVVGLISSVPPIVIQLVGLFSIISEKMRYSKAKKALLKEENDAQIIHF